MHVAGSRQQVAEGYVQLEHKDAKYPPFLTVDTCPVKKSDARSQTCNRAHVMTNRTGLVMPVFLQSVFLVIICKSKSCLAWH